METGSSRKKHKTFWAKKMIRRWINGRDVDEQLNSTNKLYARISTSTAGDDVGQQEQSRKSFLEREDPIFMSGTLSAADIDEYLSEADMSGELSKHYVPVSGPLPTPNSDSDKFRMFVGTWNVGGRAPHDGLKLQDWLCSPAPSDIYILGFQEVVPLNAGNVLVTENRGPAAKWLSLIRQALNYPRKSPAASGDEIAPVHPDQFRPPRVSFCDLITIQDMMEEGEGEGEEEWEGEEDVWVDESDVGLEGESINPNSSDEETVTGGLDHRRRLGRRRTGYCLVASKQMVGIFLSVWVRNDLVRDVARVKASCVARGIMGYMGNKGSISISMTLRGSTLCFICTHLASGENKKDEERRNYDVDEILKRTRFPRSRRRRIDPLLAPKTILQHEKIIWLGDLNYRVAVSCSETQELLLKNNWTALLEKDQLRIEQKAGKVFSGWQEGKIYFPPTYKYLTNSDCYVVQTEQSREKKRIPAWCDRILFRGEGMKQICYVRGESRFSDHRPVYSIFSIRVANAAEDIGTDITTPTSSSNALTNKAGAPTIPKAMATNATSSSSSNSDNSSKKKGYKVRWPGRVAHSATTPLASTDLRCDSSRSDTSCHKVGEEMPPISRTQSCRMSSTY